MEGNGTPGFDQIYGQKGGVTFLMKFVMYLLLKVSHWLLRLSSQPLLSAPSRTYCPPCLIPNSGDQNTAAEGKTEVMKVKNEQRNQVAHGWYGMGFHCPYI